MPVTTTILLGFTEYPFKNNDAVNLFNGSMSPWCNWIQRVPLCRRFIVVIPENNVNILTCSCNRSTVRQAFSWARATFALHSLRTSAISRAAALIFASARRVSRSTSALAVRISAASCWQAETALLATSSSSRSCRTSSSRSCCRCFDFLSATDCPDSVARRRSDSAICFSQRFSAASNCGIIKDPQLIWFQKRFYRRV